MIETFPKICLECAHAPFCRNRGILGDLHKEVERAQTHLGEDTKTWLVVDCKYFEERK